MLTKTTPKPLLPVAGKPFIEWTLASLVGIGFSRVVVSAGYRAEAVRSHFLAPRTDGLDVTVVAEAAPLGTGGAIALAARSVPEGDPVLVANGDSFIAGNLSTIWDSLDESVDGVIVAVRMGDTRRFGRLQISADGLLGGIHENEVGTGWVNGGLYLLRRRVLNRFPTRLPLSFERDVLPGLIAGEARLRVLRMEAPFIDIGVKASLNEAEAFVTAFLRNGTSDRR